MTYKVSFGSGEKTWTEEVTAHYYSLGMFGSLMFHDKEGNVIRMYNASYWKRVE